MDLWPGQRIFTIFCILNVLNSLATPKEVRQKVSSQFEILLSKLFLVGNVCIELWL